MILANLLFPHGMPQPEKRLLRNRLRMRAKYPSRRGLPRTEAWKAYYAKWRTSEKGQNSLREAQWRKRGISGFTGKDYQRLLMKQNGVCAICLRPSPSSRKLAVDHDHVTGKVRGLLCGFCNRRLITDFATAEMFQRAADYLRGGAK